jgi:hypothetical protein
MSKHPVDRHTYASKELTASFFSYISEYPVISIFRVTASNISTYITKLHGVTSQKTQIFMVTAMRTPSFFYEALKIVKASFVRQ